MKKISQEQTNLINAATAQGLSQYSPAALEKDLHLTDVLKILSAINNSEHYLFFAGGTSLSKGYGLISRMSEDLDFKVGLPASTSRSHLRKNLGLLRDQIIKTLEVEGFEINNKYSDNQNQHSVVEIKYENGFDPEASLRTIIKIELTHAPIYLPVEDQTVRTLLYQNLTNMKPSFNFPCVAPIQTMAEKTLAVLIRYLPTIHDNSKNRDPRLVRHIYDIYQLAQILPDRDLYISIFMLALKEDLAKISPQKSISQSQLSVFFEHSLSQLDKTPLIKEDYLFFVNNLVAGDFPEFDTALATFQSLSELAISKI